MTYSLGLHDYKPSARDIRTEDFWAPTKAASPEYGVLGLDWGMLGNDLFGDCYWASAAHELMAQRNDVAGKAPVFSTESVLSTYCKYLGIQRDQLNAKTDQGTDPRKGAKIRTQFGIADDAEWENHYEEPGAGGHRIGAYAFIQEASYTKLLQAVEAFEAITLCIDCPQSAQENTKVWDYVPGSPIDGGHAIAGVAIRDGSLVVISWGFEIEVTPAFIAHYFQTAMVYLSGAELAKDGTTPAGVNRPALRKILGEVTA